MATYCSRKASHQDAVQGLVAEELEQLPELLSPEGAGVFLCLLLIQIWEAVWHVLLLQFLGRGLCPSNGALRPKPAPPH